MAFGRKLSLGEKSCNGKHILSNKFFYKTGEINRIYKMILNDYVYKFPKSLDMYSRTNMERLDYFSQSFFSNHVLNDCSRTYNI